jgi:hypothetical protein
MRRSPAPWWSPRSRSPMCWSTSPMRAAQRPTSCPAAGWSTCGSARGRRAATWRPGRWTADWTPASRVVSLSGVSRRTFGSLPPDADNGREPGHGSRPHPWVLSRWSSSTAGGPARAGVSSAIGEVGSPGSNLPHGLADQARAPQRATRWPPRWGFCGLPADRDRVVTRGPADPALISDSCRTAGQRRGRRPSAAAAPPAGRPASCRSPGAGRPGSGPARPWGPRRG